VPEKALRHVCALLCFIVFAFSVVPSGAAQEIRQGIYRGMPVTYVVKHGKAIFQGDIVLEKIASIDPQLPLPSFGIDYSQYLWLKTGNQYQIPYVIASGSGNLTNLNTAITQFNNTFSNIQFVAYTGQTDYVNFYFDPNDNSGECEAIVGRAGGEQQVGGSGGTSNPCAVGTILHEMGHTVGLWHEQSRPDRNTYVSVNYDNLIKGSISNFNQIYDNGQETTLFDYASIMEYPAFSFSRNGGPAIESIPPGIPLSNYNGYTAADIDGIERLYGNAPTAVTITSNPPGLEVIIDGATVATPQVFNWPLGSTHTLDIRTFVQTQSGNIVNSNPPVPTTFLLHLRTLERLDRHHSQHHCSPRQWRTGHARHFSGCDHLYRQLHSTGFLRGHSFAGWHRKRHSIAGAPELLRSSEPSLHGPPAGHTHGHSECGRKLLRIQ
jgi:hypothetical protein